MEQNKKTFQIVFFLLLNVEEIALKGLSYTGLETCWQPSGSLCSLKCVS